ncbi:MAG: hypothetical protein OXI15_04725 [Chromatiales bacterium]|nr:hypothetical protein [Chromatiales bacterium]
MNSSSRIAAAACRSSAWLVEHEAEAEVFNSSADRNRSRGAVL